MGDHLGFERYYWFDKEARAGTFPNATTLAKEFEISKKTAQRAIEYMRDRISAPLEYDVARKGYYYSDNTFQLINLNISQEELLAILTARNILSYSAGGAISDQIARFGKRLSVILGNLGLNEQQMSESFSSMWTGYAPAQRMVFETVAHALLQNRVLLFSYSSPSNKNEATFRAVEPHHLQHYMGSWSMIGFCRMRKDWRRFMLSRITHPHVCPETFERQPKQLWVHKLEGGFGIFQGSAVRMVKLRFNAFRGPWIKEQVWHPQQDLLTLPDGSVELAFPVCELHEVKMKVLQFGGDVEVLEPADLRAEVSAEANKICAVYVQEDFS